MITINIMILTAIDKTLIEILLIIFLSFMAKLWWKVNKPIIFSPVNKRFRSKFIDPVKRRSSNANNQNASKDFPKEQQNIQDPAKPPGSTF